MNTVTTIRHTDVRGKELFYLKAVNTVTGKEYLINVGKSTYEAVKNLGESTITDENLKKGEEAGLVEGINKHESPGELANKAKGNAAKMGK